MKKLFTTFLLYTTLFAACKKDNDPTEELIGTWQLAQTYNSMDSSTTNLIEEDQRIEEYTKDCMRIRYDYQENEFSRCLFRATETLITIYGTKTDGSDWNLSYEYWISADTLKIRNSGGFEFYDEFFIRIKLKVLIYRLIHIISIKSNH